MPCMEPRSLIPLVLAALAAATSKPLLAQPIEAPVLEANVDGIVEPLDLRIDQAAMTGPPPELWSGALTRHDADYVRLLLRVEGEEFPPDAFFRLSSGLGQRFDMRLSEIGPNGRWSPILPFGRVRMALVSSTVPENAALVIESLVVQNVKGSLYSNYGTNDLKYINAAEVPPELKAHSSSVAILYFLAGGKPRTCTGFLVEPDLLLTNEHCINNASTCASMTAVFGFEYDESGRLGMGPQVGCLSYDPHASAFNYDVTAVRLRSAPGSEFATISLTDAVAVPAGDLFIIQHPGSQPKQISYIECRSVAFNVAGRAEGTDFTHTCDTASGSSGAPVFTLDGRFAGLHHFGFKESGSGTWTENRAVHADLIGEWIEQ